MNPLELVRRFWFPALLVLLFLVALPGWVLFALHLFGLEGDTNQWLQDNFKLTYQLALPWWGGLILLLVPFLLVLLYFLKLKRKPLQVPSTFLWKKSVEDLHVNSLLQWLRENVLLLLQLLVLICLPYAVMTFRFHGRNTEGRHYIVMIDNSASMGTTDVAPSRLAWAKQEALKEIDAASDTDFGMVIEFNSSAKTLQSRTSNKDLLRRAVQSIQQTQRPTKIGDQPSGIEDALTLADSLANPSKSTDDAAVRPAGEEPDKLRTYVQAEGVKTEVHLYSDGCFPDVREFALGNLALNFHMAGKPGPENQDNVGITRFNAFRDESDPSKVQVFVSAINGRDKSVKARIQIEVQATADANKAIYEKSLELPPREIKTEEVKNEQGKLETRLVSDTLGEAAVTFDLKDLDDRGDVVLHARLLDTRDSFPLDDEAWLVLGVVRKARILIVTKGNEVLDKFFSEELLKDVARVERIQPGMLDSEENYLTPARNGDFDLVIFDRCTPKKEEDMPRGNTFFIGQPPPGWRKVAEGEEPKAMEKVNSPHVKGWLHRHALLRYLVALHEIGIGEAFKASVKDLPPRTPALIESDLETVLLFTLNRQAFTDLVMTFPILTDKDEWNTNWPLKPSFPLFLRNVLYSLGNVSDAAAEELTQPGQVKTLRPDVGVAEIEVRGPTGTHKLQRGTRADFTFGGGEQVGIYQVYWNNKLQRSFAVNLLDKNESNLEPRSAVKIGAEESETKQTANQPRSMWKWIVLAALGLLMLEWYIYNRRVYI
jgi:hypothetical protein